MHAEPKMAIMAVGLLALLVGLGLFSMLFLFKKSRPLGWILLGVIVAAMCGMTIVSSRTHHYRPVPPPYQGAYNAHGRAEHGHAVYDEHGRAVAVMDYFHQHHEFPPGIQLHPDTVVVHDSAVGEDSAHPVAPADSAARIDATRAEPLDAEESARLEGSAQSDTGEPSPTESVETRAEAETTMSQERPSWVDEAPRRSGNSYFAVVATDQFPKRQQADRQLNELIVVKTAEVVGDLVDLGFARNDTMPHEWQFQNAVHYLTDLGLTPGTLRNEVWREEYIEHHDLDLETGPMPMVQAHALLEYDQEFQNELQHRWRQRQARERLGAIGVVTAGVLGLLGLAWGVLKFDTATKGYYTKRLVIGGAVVAALATCAALMAA